MALEFAVVSCLLGTFRQFPEPLDRFGGDEVKAISIFQPVLSQSIQHPGAG